MRECLTVWETPDCYAGFNPVGDFVAYALTRDCSLVIQSNFTCIQSALGEHCYTFRAGHWGCGWVDYLMVPKDAPEGVLDELEEIVRALEGYPVVSDDHYSELQRTAIYDHWTESSLRYRVGYCQEASVSIFAARQDCIPGPVYDELSESEGFY